MSERKVRASVADLRIVRLALGFGWAIGLGCIVAARGDEQATPTITPKAKSSRLQESDAVGARLTVTNEPICIAHDQPLSIRPVHRVSLRADPVDVRRAGLRRQLRGRAALPCRIPQGDGSAGEAVVSRRRGPSRRFRPRPCRAVQRQSIAADHAEARRPLHAGNLARGQARQGGRAAAVFSVPSRRGLQSPVQVAIWGQGQTYASATFRPAQAWQRFETVLEPDGTDPAATLSISFRGPGTLWIDQVSLMSADNVCGWRRDVAEALKALRPGIIRFGGSTTEGFEWTATIGDPAKRVPFTTCWGGLEPGNAGLEEFVQLCRWVGAEPLICVRFTGRTPKQAAEQVEYFNGPATTPMGKLRAANGHPAPYGVRYWQIGNELGDEAYQKGVAEFCKAMKAVDPGIKLLAAFPSPGLLQRAGPWLDYVCPHHYGCQNLSAMEEDVARCREADRRKRAGPGNPPGYYRVEHHRRRLGAWPGYAVDPRQCLVVQPIPQLHAPPLRYDRDRQSQQPDRQFLRRHYPDQRHGPFQNPHLLCPTALRHARRHAAAQDPHRCRTRLRPLVGHQRHAQRRRPHDRAVRRESHDRTPVAHSGLRRAGPVGPRACKSGRLPTPWAPASATPPTTGAIPTASAPSPATPRSTARSSPTAYLRCRSPC